MKKSGLIVLTILLFSLLAFSAYSITCGFQNPTPAASGTLSGSDIINVSFADPASTSLINVSVFLQSAAISRNTTLSTLFNYTNVTQGTGVYVNGTFYDAYAFDDANDYTLSCSCQNATTTVACNATRAVTVDRTNPAAPTAITFTNPVKATNTITATIDRVNANRCFVKFGGNPKQAMTLSGSTCTYTVQSNTPPNADYDLVVSADDRTDTEAVAAKRYISIMSTVNGDGAWLGGALEAAQNQDTGQSILGGGSSNPFAPKPTGLKAIPPIGWVVIAIILVAMFWNKKK